MINDANHYMNKIFTVDPSNRRKTTSVRKNVEYVSGTQLDSDTHTCCRGFMARRLIDWLIDPSLAAPALLSGAQTFGPGTVSLKLKPIDGCIMHVCGV